MPRNYKYISRAGAYVKDKTRENVDYDALATRQWAELIAFFRWYPDLLEDVCEGENCEYHNSLIGRVIKRAMVRYQQSFFYGARGLGKTTCIISAASNKGITYPGEVMAYYAPAEKQAAKIASEAFHTYANNYPYLARHWTINSDAAERFKISTEFGSALEIDIDRGRNTHSVIAEECGQEDQTPFNWSVFNQVVKATNRKQHMVNGRADKSHQDIAETYITSASRKQNPAYAKCRKIRQKMFNGESAFAMWVPWQVPVLCKMKPYEYYANLRDDLTSEEFMRECEAKCTGSIQNPIIQDSVLEGAKKVFCMEDRHCGDPDALYVLGYDVSQRDVSGNALTGLAVIKAERQFDTAKWDKYKKSLVYVADSRPPLSAREHARVIKRKWADYSMAGGLDTFVVIDARSYGQSVMEALHEDLQDGLPPLCTVTHEEPYNLLEHEGAIPCLYPLQASANTGRDPNSVMLDYIEREFENGNFRILTTNTQEGLQAYKLKHGIKDDLGDAKIQTPYIKTRELCRQIGNLQKKYTATGWIEAEITKRIPKDMWSATLYAARYIQRLEKDELYYANRRKNRWEEATAAQMITAGGPAHTRAIKRLGRGAISR